MKKKNIDRKEKLKKIGKIGLTIFNVLTGIWFFISFICIIIAACSGSLTTSGNNNGGGNRILSDVSSSLEVNVSEVARHKYETRDDDIEVNDDRNIGNDYNVDGIQNYNTNYILTCYDDVDVSRQYHMFMQELYLKDTLRNIAFNVQTSFYSRIRFDEYFQSSYLPTGQLVCGFQVNYRVESGNINFIELRVIYYDSSNQTRTSYTAFLYSIYLDEDNLPVETFVVSHQQRANDFYKLCHGNLHFDSFEVDDMNYIYGVYYFSEYSIHDIGIYFNTGSLLANFGVFFEPIATDIPSAVSNIPSNVYGIHGSGWSDTMYSKIDGVFHRPGYNSRWDFIYIEYKRIDNYVFDLETRQMLFNPSQYRSQYDYFYIPYSIGLGNGWHLSQPTYHHTICQLAQYMSSSYFLGIDSQQNVETILIDSIPGDYLIGGSDGVSYHFTLFYGLKNQCAFVNGFYFFIDPNGNVHTGLTGSATGGDISSSYIGDVFKLINQILTSFTGFFGYYLLPGVSIGLLFALPLIFTIILFVVKLFKR